MATFLLRRLLSIIPVLLGIILITFILVRSIPGDPCVAMLGERATPEKCNDYRERFGLNDDIGTQFLRYSGGLLSGDLGTSIGKDSRLVIDLLLDKLPFTIELAVGAMIFALLFGVPLGIIAAYRHRSMVDVLTMMGANLGVSIPIFWLGLMLQGLFGTILKDTSLQLPTQYDLTSGVLPDSLVKVWNLQSWDAFPRGVVTFFSNMNTVNGVLTGRWDITWDAIRHLILPSIALGTIPMSIIARLTRSNLLDVMGLDYIRTAHSKGLGERLVLFRHAMRNALLPLVTVIGLQFGALLGGAVLTETVFTLPGIGSFLVNAIFERNYPVVQGFTIIIAIIFVLANLLVDLSYAFLDPRIRLN